MNRIAVAFLAAAIAGGGQEDKPCDLAKTELRDYCSGCKRWPASDQIEKTLCRACKSKVEKAETCIKFCWDCPTAHDGKPRRHSKKCGAAPNCCKETPSLALVWYVCEGCKGRATKPADVRHANEKCTAASKRACGNSGAFPHGGEE